MSTEQTGDLPADRDFARLMITGCVLVGIALFGGLLAASKCGYLSSAGIIIVTLSAGLAGGAAIGFLFGIPRVLPNAELSVRSTADSSPSGKGSQTNSARRFLTSNSNLVEVSDWLTKIILGVSLTQIYRLNSLLAGFEALVADHAGPSDRGTPLAATILLVFATIAGFLAMYLETRFVVSRMFNSVERDLETAEALNSDYRSALMAMTDSPNTTPTMLAAAADSLKSAARSDSGHPEMRLVAAQALAASGRTSEASDLLSTRDLATVRGRISAMRVALYKLPPEGFREALEIAANLNSSPSARESADFWFLEAAAFGQEHHFLLRDNASESERKSTRDNALDAVRRCLSIDASYRRRLFWLLHPESSPTPSDDDLADFAGDPDFEAQVGPTT
jgi:hypothetical protein